MLHDDLLHTLRALYRYIYHWHKENGLREFDKRHDSGEFAHRRGEYLAILEKMSSPESADIETIAYIAHAVSNGCMEWAYSEAVHDRTLGSVASRILTVLEAHQETAAIKDREEELRRLPNVGSESASCPAFVDIKLLSDYLDPDKYLYYCSIAYSDVRELAKAEHLGGEVALGDTNLEHENQRGERRSNRHIMRFRNAAALHFVPESEPNSLVSLTQSGVVSIISVTIGSTEDRRR